ncbi:hypothetical protein [Pseudonocardia sp. TRM90224]|uniref:hypothetical protein n=1 Tax=Pseudonocardia sp. TRM90224 TaxID=2812678 RepID=UPI001E653A5B|nr:hypothetical protein [Pseudonocardia sp. TRM90224]
MALTVGPASADPTHCSPSVKEKVRDYRGANLALRRCPSDLADHYSYFAVMNDVPVGSYVHLYYVDGRGQVPGAVDGPSDEWAHEETDPTYGRLGELKACVTMGDDGEFWCA